MIKMKIKLDEENVMKNSKYTLKELYNKIDKLAKDEGITKKDESGLYIGNNDNNDYSNFGNTILELKERKWFTPFVKEWLWYVDGEVDDVAEFYHLKGEAYNY